MKISEFIKKVRIYSFISFFCSVIAINACFFLYKMLADLDLFENIQWDQKKVEIEIEDYILAHKSLSFTNCGKYHFEKSYKDKKGAVYFNDSNTVNFSNRIETVIIKQTDRINNKCVKNRKFYYLILSNFSSYEKLLIKAKKNNKSGFSKIKNPYLYGEVSISRTARYYPANLIFKSLLLLSSLLLFLYWKNNLNIFKELKNKKVIEKFSKKFFYFGILSCIFLALHASLFNMDIDSKLFKNFRRLIIISFILFEVLAQTFLTINLFKYKNKLKIYVNTIVINIKSIFIVTIIFITFFSIVYLAFGEVMNSVKYILEWNYFHVLLLYYGLSYFLWKKI